jgi:mRNA-degrading endonuclease RelE of RelBE toxin-antitoxin system
MIGVAVRFRLLRLTSAMAFQISITDEADAQLHALSAREQRIVEAAVTARLRDQPTIPTKAVRRLRPNPLAEFELRVQDFRVLYNVDRDSSEVLLLIVGRKVGNKLIVGGREFHGHRGDPPESTSDGHTGPAGEVL